MADINWFAVAVALGGATAGAVTDVWRHRVYNAMTIPLFCGGIAYHVYVDGWHGLSLSLLGAGFGFVLLILPHLVGLMGAGDVKLLMALGAWLGPTMNLTVFVVSSLIAGVYALALMLYRGKLRESWATMRAILYRFAAVGTYFCKDDLVEELDAGAERRLRVIPYGAMLPLGIIGALVWLLCF